MVSLVSALALATSGCVASHTWAPGPHQSAANFTETSGRCKLMAMGAADSGGEFAYAQGSPRFVGSYLGAVTIASAVGGHNRGQNAYNACMEASGFYAVDTASGSNAPAAAATQDPKVAQMMELMSQMKACVQAVRDKPIYMPLQPHFINLGSGQYTMAQLADTGIPTPSERQLLIGFHDEALSCYNRFSTVAYQLVPALEPVITQERSDSDAVQLRLVNGQLTWGEAAQRMRQILEVTASKLHTLREVAMTQPVATAPAQPVAKPVITTVTPAPAATPPQPVAPAAPPPSPPPVAAAPPSTNTASPAPVLANPTTVPSSESYDYEQARRQYDQARQVYQSKLRASAGDKQP